MQRLPPACPSVDAKLFGILLAGMFGQTRPRDASEFRLKVVTEPADAESDEEEPPREP